MEKEIEEMLSEEDYNKIKDYRNQAESEIKGFWFLTKLTSVIMYRIFIILVLLGIFLKDYGIDEEYIKSVITIGLNFLRIYSVLIAGSFLLIMTLILAYSIRRDKLLREKGYIAKFHQSMYDKSKTKK